MIRPLVALLAALALGSTQAYARCPDLIFSAGLEDFVDAPNCDEEAARFLTMATFGPSPAEITRLRAIGYDVWFQQQFAQAPTLARPFLEALQAGGTVLSQGLRQDRWFTTAVYAPDQLRQRVAFALSQILVISDRVDTLSGDILGVAEFSDILASQAFGSYRETLEQVTLSPQMGRFLTSLRNNGAANATTTPDENYAREVMQLFTIGLTRRNLDFSPVLDAQNQPVPTYDQIAVTNYAKVFTGWTYSGSASFGNGQANFLQMMCFEANHNIQPKVLLEGFTLPGGANRCRPDLESALDVLVNHPTAAPFLSRQLIQRLVTSNPSSAYIQRVANVFVNNGSGVRGDLTAVVRAVLMDSEARNSPVGAFGKAREPLLKLTAIWRALEAQPVLADRMGTQNPEGAFAQRHLGAATVFNFYEPDYQQPGPIETANLYSPELQIINESTIVGTGNALRSRSQDAYVGMATPPTDGRPLVNLAPLIALVPSAAGHGALIDELNRRLMYGSMSPQMRAILLTMLANRPTETPLDKVRQVVSVILLSPEFAVQN